MSEFHQIEVYPAINEKDVSQFKRFVNQSTKELNSNSQDEESLTNSIRLKIDEGNGYFEYPRRRISINEESGYGTEVHLDMFHWGECVRCFELSLGVLSESLYDNQEGHWPR